MAALTRFEELFGDESFNFSTTPELVDVSPGLISTDSKYASKELNQRRQAVTGRSFRSPVPRSMNPRQTIAPQQSESEPEPEWIPSNRKGPTDPGLEGGGPGGGGAFGPEGASGQYLIEQQGDTGRLGAGTLGNETGDSLASSLGTMGVMGATTATLGALSMGAPSSMIPGIATGSFVSSALNPIALANIVGGGLYAGQTGYNAGNNAANPSATTDVNATPENISNAQIAAFNAIDPGLGGLAELGVEGLLSMLGIGMSPTEGAMSAAHGSLASSGAFADAYMTSEQGYVSNAPGSSVSQDAVNAQMDTEASLANLVSGYGTSPNGLGPSNAASDPSQGMVTPGGFVGNVPSGVETSMTPSQQAFQSFSQSGNMGVGPGGLTDAISGLQGSLFGGTGFNPHASEMDIPAAPTPTVFGQQGHGDGGQGQGGNASGTGIGGYQGGHSGDPGSGPGGGGGGK